MVKRIFSGIFQYIRAVDKLLILAILALSSFGVVAVSSATANNADYNWKRCVTIQIAASAIGFIVMIVLSKVDYEILGEISPIIVGVCAALLLFTAFFGTEVNGNKNWIDLKFIMVQPSEFTKTAFAITMGTHLKKLGKDINKLKNILLVGLHFACYALPIILQKDIGTVLIYLGMFVAMLFVAGIYYRYMAMFAVLGIAAVPIIWSRLGEYQQSRIIYGFQPELDPLGYGLQPIVSKIAIGSGGMNGMGYGNGIQNQNSLLPEKATDFIFSIIGEEFGFIGCMGIILLLLLIAALVIKNGIQAKDKAGAYLCTAIGVMLLLQSCINIGMCVGLSPVIGVTLPFVSYGGSSVLSLFVCMGFVQGVRVKPERVLSFTKKRRR